MIKFKRLKKRVALLMAFVICISITGCNGDNSVGIFSQSKNEDSENSENDTGYYETALKNDIETQIISYFVRKSGIYIETYNEDNNKYSIVKYDMNNSTTEEVPIDLNPGEYISRLFVDNSDRLFVSTNDSSETGDSARDNIVKIINSDGSENGFIVDSDFTPEENVQYSAFMQEDADGNTMLFTDKAVYIYDENLNKKSSIDFESDYVFIDSACTNKGEVVVAFLESAAQSYITICKIDVIENRFKEILTLQSDISNALMDGNEDELYVNGGDGVYILDTETRDMELLFSYSDAYISPSSVERMASFDSSFFISSEFDDNEELYLTYISKQENINKNKKKIVLAVCGIPTSLVKNVDEFNRENADCYIEIKDYSEEEDPDLKMAVDVASSDMCPDIICFDSGFCPSDYITPHMMEDLTPYIEGDEELEKSDILDPVLNALEDDGHIYFSASNYFLRTLMVKSKNVSNKPSGWTYKEMLSAFEKSGCTRLYPYDSSEALLLELGYLGLNDFVDMDTGTCTIDSIDFSEYLQACKKYGKFGIDNSYSGEEDIIDELYQRVEDFNEGELFVIDCDEFDPVNCQINRIIYGDDITYIGYPNASGEGSYFDLIGKYGIFANSENKDEAWKFVRKFFTEDYQSKNMSEVMPCRKDCFEEKIKEFTAEDNYVNRYGEEITSLNNVDSWEAYGLTIKVRSCDEKEIDDYMAVLNSTKKYYDVNSTVVSIVQEECDAYFSGEKSLDEQLQVMQSRIELYISEHR